MRSNRLNRKQKFTSAEMVKKYFFMKKLRNFIFKSFIACIVLGACFVSFVFWGPYEQLKETFIATAMTTLSHQYLAKFIASDEEIQQVMEKNKIQDPNFNTNQDEVLTDQFEHDKKTQVTIEEVSGKNYKGYMLIIPDPSKVVVRSTSKLGIRGDKLEDIVEASGAIAGINAGGFLDTNGRGNGGTPSGILIQDGKIISKETSRKQLMIGLNDKNVLTLGKFSLDEMQDLKIRDAAYFRPFLIVNGVPTIKEGDGGWGLGPRSVIGQRVDGTILLLAIDGRQVGYSIGASLKETQDLMLSYGAHNAANLDGGSSTTLYYDGKIVNKPCSKYGARYIPSALVVMP